MTLLQTTPIANAHPLSQGRIEVVISRDKIMLWASVAIEQVVVQQSLPTNDDGVVVTQSDAYRAHGTYILKHLFLSADGQRLDGHVTSIQEPDNKVLTPGEPGKEYVVYGIEFTPAALPANIELRQDILLEVLFSPGNPWQATYITGIRQDGSQGQENMMLTSSNTLKFTCDWSAKPATTTAQAAPKSAGTVDAPPENLKKPVPESAPDRSHFIAGLAIGISTIYLLALMIKKLRRQ